MRTPIIPVHERAAESAEPLDLSDLSSVTGTEDYRLGTAPSAAPARATFLRSFVYAWDGVAYALRTQRNARVHLAAAAGALALGVVLHISAVEFALLLLAVMAVLLAELFNTVAEAIVDMVTAEYHPLARIAKDVAAGGVLLCALFAVAIGVLVFSPHLWPLLAHLAAR
jgi:diacylglycerol kinase